jgi:hypothetical protein
LRWRSAWRCERVACVAAKVEDQETCCGARSRVQSRTRLCQRRSREVQQRCSREQARLRVAVASGRP